MNISPNSAQFNLSFSSAPVNKAELQTTFRSAKKLLGTRALTDQKIEKAMNQLATNLAKDGKQPYDLARAGNLLKAGVQLKGQGTVHGSWLGQIRDKHQSQKTEKILKKIDNVLAKNGFNSGANSIPKKRLSKSQISAPFPQSKADKEALYAKSLPKRPLSKSQISSPLPQQSKEEIEALYAKPTSARDQRPEVRMSLTAPPLPPKPPRTFESELKPSGPVTKPTEAGIPKNMLQGAASPSKSVVRPQSPPPPPPLYADLVRPGEAHVSTDNPRPPQNPPGESTYAQVKSA